MLNLAAFAMAVFHHLGEEERTLKVNLTWQQERHISSHQAQSPISRFQPLYS